LTTAGHRRTRCAWALVAPFVPRALRGGWAGGGTRGRVGGSAVVSAPSFIPLLYTSTPIPTLEAFDRGFAQFQPRDIGECDVSMTISSPKIEVNKSTPKRRQRM